MGKQRDLNIEEKTMALAWRIDGVSTKVIERGWDGPSIPFKGCFSWKKCTAD
jgi:hypothetical protein